MSRSPSLDRRSAGLLLALAAVWGGSFLLAEIALREVPPLTIVLHRVSWAVPLVYLALRAAGHAVPRDLRTWLGFLVMGALNNALPFSLIFWGQTQIESGLAAILNATTGIFGAVVAGLFLAAEPLLPRKVAGAAIGVAGVATVMGPAALAALDPRNLAQLAVLGAALSYAFAGVWARAALAGTPPLVNAFGMLTATAVLMAPIALAVDGVPSVALAPATWAALAVLSAASTALAYLLYFSIAARAGAANLLLVTLLIPAVAVGLGALFLGEALPPRAHLGLAIIGLGLVVTDGRLFRRRGTRNG